MVTHTAEPSLPYEWTQFTKKQPNTRVKNIYLLAFYTFKIQNFQNVSHQNPLKCHVQSRLTFTTL